MLKLFGFMLPVCFLVCCASHLPTDVKSSGGLGQPVCPAGTFIATHGKCVPEQWTCSPLYYAAGAQDGCDCDCGVPDPDCALPSFSESWLYGTGQPHTIERCPAARL